MSELGGIAAGAAAAGLILSVAGASPASAAADTTCGNPSTNWAQEFCISKYPNANGSTDNNMTYGWTASSFSGTNYYALGNEKYSNSGGTVQGNVYSARNKDNVYGKIMCFYDGGSVPYYYVNVSYGYLGWKNLSTWAAYSGVLETRSSPC